MEMTLGESSWFLMATIATVMKNSDVGRGATVPRSDIFAPFREAGVRKPHLAKEVLLAAIQPLRRNQRTVSKGRGSCRFIVSETINDFVHDLLGELGGHNDSGVLTNEGTSGNAM